MRKIKKGRIKMEAIIYTSNAGSTKRYAEMLSQKTGLAVYSLKEASKKVAANSEIIYMGWLMGSGIKGYKAASKKYKICAVCAVGMTAPSMQIKEITEVNEIPENIPLFKLQGDFDIEKLHGIYKLMMKIMVKALGNTLSKKTDRTEDEDDMLEMLLNGGKRVAEENIAPIVEWYEGKRNTSSAD